MQTAIAETSALGCLRCGYDLRGLAPAGVCPECGLGVERSLVGNRELHRGRPAWLRRLWIGIVLLVSTPVLVGAFLFLRLLDLPMTERELMSVPIVVAVIHATGLFLLTSRENRFERKQPGNVLRVTLRMWSLNGPALAFCIIEWLRSDGRAQKWAYASLVPVLLLAPCCSLMFLYLRRLAIRVRNPSLAEHCGILAVGTAATILSPFAFYLVSRHGDPPGTFAINLGICVSFFLFLIWSACLMTRFAIEFRRAARAAKQSWIEADAAATELM